MALIRNKVKPDGRPYLNPEDELDVNTLTEDTIVCKCVNTTFGDVLEAVRMGMTTLDEVIEWTNAVTACQKCKRLLGEVLDHALAVADPFA